MKNGPKRQIVTRTNGKKSAKSAGKRQSPHIIALRTRSHDKENPKQQRQSSIVMYCEELTASGNPLALKNESYTLEGLPTKCLRSVCTVDGNEYSTETIADQLGEKCHSGTCGNENSRELVSIKYSKDKCRKKQSSQTMRKTLKSFSMADNGEQSRLRSNQTEVFINEGSCSSIDPSLQARTDGSDDTGLDEGQSSCGSQTETWSVQTDSSDYLLAKKLQETYDRENRHRLNTIRDKNGDNPYQLRTRSKVGSSRLIRHLLYTLPSIGIDQGSPTGSPGATCGP